ncbi:MAG TPA: zinc-binding dehydrogenase [Kofleriaceae bacterium]|nr:zinc-binding dehydrogenase [Kofleriaceae bacterium]
MRDATMRALVIAGPGRAEVREVPRPAPGPDQVLIEVEGCGVCGSNLPIWEGRPWFTYPAPPGSPGHEGWGRIVACGDGDGRDGLRPGDRVAFLSERAFAAYDVADRAAVVALPPALADRAVPGEALGCAINIARRSGLAAGQVVAVIGAGFLGALLVQLAARVGARVIAVSRRPASLEVARAMGATEVLALDDADAVVGQVEALTGGAGCDRVIEVTGLQGPLDLAARLCRTRGRLIIAGFHQDGRRTVDLFLWNWRGLDVINAHEREPAVYVDGMQAAIAAVADGTLDPEPLYTHRVALADAGAAFALLAGRPAGFVKALVVP